MKRHLSKNPHVSSKKRATQAHGDSSESAVHLVLGIPEILEIICSYVLGDYEHDPLYPYRILGICRVSKSFNKASHDCVRRVDLCHLISQCFSWRAIGRVLQKTPKATGLRCVCKELCDLTNKGALCGAFTASNMCFENKPITRLAISRLKKYCRFSLGSFANLESLSITHSNYHGVLDYSVLRRLTELELNGVCTSAPVKLPQTLKKLSIISSRAKYRSTVSVIGDLPNLEDLIVSPWLRDEGWEKEDVWSNAPFSPSLFPNLKTLTVEGRTDMYPTVFASIVEDPGSDPSTEARVLYRVFVPGFGTREDFDNDFESEYISRKIPPEYALKEDYRKEWILQKKSRSLVEGLDNMLLLFQYFHMGWSRTYRIDSSNFRLGRVRRLHDWVENGKEFPVFKGCKEVGSRLSDFFSEPSK